MNLTTDYMVLLSVFSFLAGISLFWIYQRRRLGSFQIYSQQIIRQAEVEAGKKNHDAEKEILLKHQAHQKQVENSQAESIKKIRREEERLYEKEKKLEEQLSRFEVKLIEIESKEKKVQKALFDIEEKNRLADEDRRRIKHELGKLGGMSSDEAKSYLIAALNDELAQEKAAFLKKVKADVTHDADQIATKMIMTAINRLSISCVSESQNHTIPLPNDEIKRRLIGKEGRNIKTLEMLTGINLSVDITPGAIVLSGFDPVRMHVAKAVLADLINDGRIHPTKIEETFEKCHVNIHKQIIQFGESAAHRAGVIGLHPEMIRLLGQLKFRYSLGQNVLEHSLEVCHIMGLLAAELHLDVRLAKRIGLLHDIGKAVSHEIEGTHALIGRDLALKYGESAEVANGIGCHHDEIEPISMEGSLCKPADAISAARPGARIEPVEEYVKRLTRLEKIANRFEGVETAYALQAGRELRVFVKPEIIDDAKALLLAREISKQIETELTYPGRIKVTVSREKRVVEYAL